MSFWDLGQVLLQSVVVVIMLRGEPMDETSRRFRRRADQGGSGGYKQRGDYELALGVVGHI